MSVTYAQPATVSRSPPRALAPRVRSGRVRPWHHVPAGGVHARAQDLECAVDNYSDQHRKHCLPHRQGPHAQRPRLTAAASPPPLVALTRNTQSLSDNTRDLTAEAVHVPATSVMSRRPSGATMTRKRSGATSWTTAEVKAAAAAAEVVGSVPVP
eukprot:CAMPEP_0181349864 /NCGR_PEP_ID=MMETSP1106-20121128/956_1 /TAXON_ID=81844 /ORGANISM="Mantoniella antarctica, Strain SL-175" /LENGTH=154 /DNA_ID=CAMNT_0023462291 /DNA_START=491 /DNA_END=951 /DNA_ORIENTATION=+